MYVEKETNLKNHNHYFTNVIIKIYSLFFYFYIYMFLGQVSKTTGFKRVLLVSR